MMLVVKPIGLHIVKYLHLPTISFEGVKLRELTHAKLEEVFKKKDGYLHDIDVRGGKMVLACRAEEVMLFRMS